MRMTVAEVIPLLTEPFVRMGVYKSQEEAFKELVLEQVRQRIEEAEKEAAFFRQKYGLSFDEFTASLAGKANTEEEDDWMMWESARDMLKSWQTIEAEIRQSNV